MTDLAMSIELHQISNNDMSSLEQLAAQTIGENEDKIGLNRLQELPNKLQEKVAWFLSASTLLQQDDFLTKRGVNLDPVWMEHVKKLWPREMQVWREKADPMKRFFQEKNPKELYCRLLFEDFLSNQGHGPRLDRCFFTPLHQIERARLFQETPLRELTLSQQKQTILVPLSRNLCHLTLGNRLLSKLIEDYGKDWETLLSNVQRFRVFSISRTKGVHALRFLLQAMAERSLEAFGLDLIHENGAVLTLLLLVCSGILQQGPRAMEVINLCLSEFSACQRSQAEPFLELIHDFLFPPLTVDPPSDISDASDDDSDHDHPKDLYNEALQPLTSPENREPSFEMKRGKDQRNQTGALLPVSADDAVTGDMVKSNHCICTWLHGGNYTHVPREHGFPQTGLECFVLNRPNEWTRKVLELSLPHWTSLRKLVLGFIPLDCQTLRSLLPLVERGQLTHLLLDGVQPCRSLFARIVRALAAAQGCRGQAVPVLQHLTLKFRFKELECEEEYEHFSKEVTPTPMHGVEELVLYIEMPDVALENLVFAYLQADLSITSLTLSTNLDLCCHWMLPPHRIMALVADKASLTNVYLTGVKLNSKAALEQVVKLFSNCQKLQSLAFTSCFCSGDELFSEKFREEFVSQILHHPSLKTLILHDAQCGEVSLKVLEAILGESTVLETLVLRDIPCPLKCIRNLTAEIQGGQKTLRKPKLRYLEVELKCRNGEKDREVLEQALRPFVEEFQYTDSNVYSQEEFMAMM